MASSTLLARPTLLKADHADSYGPVASAGLAMMPFESRVKQNKSARGGFIGDSTGVSDSGPGTRWIYQLGAWRAGKSPTHTLRYWNWTDGNTDYNVTPSQGSTATLAIVQVGTLSVDLANVTTTSGSATLTAAAGTFTTDMERRTPMAAGIPRDARIIAVSTDGTTATMDKAATASATVTVTVAPVIDWFNGSVSGKRTSYHLAPNFDAFVTNLQADFWWISHGHNEAPAGVNVSAADYEPRMLALIEKIALVAPMAGIIVNAQNPQFYNPGAGWTPLLQDVADQAERAQAVYRLCSMRAYALCDIYRAYMDTGRPDLYLVDGKHPNADGTNLMLAEAQKLFVYAPGAPARPKTRSAMIEAPESLLTNGDFSVFDGSHIPTGWTSTDAITYSKDTTNGHFHSQSGWAVQMVAPAGGGSVFQDLSAAALALCLGSFFTAAIEVYIPIGQASTAGRINVQVTAASLPGGSASVTSASYADGQGAVRVVASPPVFVPVDATRIRVRLYADSATAGQASFSRVTCVRNRVFAMSTGIQGPTGATGATGAAGPSGAGVWADAITAGDLTLFTNATGQADPALAVAVDPNCTYEIVCDFYVSCPVANTAQFNCAFAYLVGGVDTAPVAGLWGISGLQIITTTVTSSVERLANSFGKSNKGTSGAIPTITQVTCRGTLKTGASAATLQAYWAQNVTDATHGTTRYGPSCLRASKMVG